MNEAPYIPQRTADLLASDHPEGTRHEAKIKIAIPLLGNGLSASAVEAELVGKFPNATAKEIRDVVRWCAGISPTPSGYGPRASGKAPTARLNGTGNTVTAVNPSNVIKEAVGVAEWQARSPMDIPADFRQHAALAVEMLYAPGEFLCGYTEFGTKPDGRTFPRGIGTTKAREQWLARFSEKGIWESGIGLWWRLNPLTESGTGTNGAHTDADVTCFRYYLLEHDKLPIDQQLSLLAALKLPIAAIVLTGGKSAHAWVAVRAQNAENFAEIVASITAATGPLGFDTNKNPSRLGRLPGALRKIGIEGDGQQRLIYLNPTPPALNLAAFEAAACPIAGLVRGNDMAARVREYMRPKEKPFTFTFLDARSEETGFFFRDFEITLWTGVSGHGKTTLLTQLMIELAFKNIPFFVCSLEHKAEGVCVAMSRIIKHGHPTAAEAEKFLTTFGDRFSFGDIVGDIEIEQLFELMEGAAKRYGAKHFFIDSLMRIAGLEEDYPAQTAFMNRLQAFIKRVGGHVHLVAHPRKSDELVRLRKQDVKGSNNIVNNTDNILSLRRNVQKRDLENEGKTAEAEKMHDAEFSVEKQRQTGVEFVVRLTFDRDARTFATFEGEWKKPDQPRAARPDKRKWNNQ